MYTMVLDVLVEKYDIYTALVFGKVWRYEQGKDKVCSASYQRIADELGISRRKVVYCIETLKNDNLIFDLSADKRNTPGVTRKYKTNQGKLKEISSAPLALPIESSASHAQSSAPDARSSACSAKSSAPDALKESKETIINNKERDFSNFDFSIRQAIARIISEHAGEQDFILESCEEYQNLLEDSDQLF